MPTTAEIAESNEELKQVLHDPSISHLAASRSLGVSERSIRRYRKKIGSPPKPKASKPVKQQAEDTSQKGQITVTPGGAEVSNIVTDQPILNGDWTSIFLLFNLDPAEFEVVDDTVRMSTWQQSKGLEDGSRSTVQLYSYSARFRRIQRTEENTETLRRVRKDLLKVRPLLIKSTGLRPVYPCPTTYKFDIADPQLGKKRTAEAVENWRNGVTRHLEEAYLLNPTDIHVAFQGDETENVYGHYGNQSATVELNSSEQEQLDLELRIWTIREALSLGLPVSVSSVISNHGERRTSVGGDPLMSRGDNSSTKIARMARMHFNLSNPDLPLTWHISEDSTPFVVVEHSGVKAYYSHGYVEQGAGNSVEKKLIDAVEKQILGRPEILTDVKLVYVAHYHHAWSNDQRGRTFFGDPALEAVQSSEWVLDRFGQWSVPGMLGMLVGNHTPRGYSNLHIF